MSLQVGLLSCHCVTAMGTDKRPPPPHFGEFSNTSWGEKQGKNKCRWKLFHGAADNSGRETAQLTGTSPSTSLEDRVGES